MENFPKELLGLTSYEIGERIDNAWKDGADIDDILDVIYKCKCGCGKYLEMYDGDNELQHYGCPDAPDHLTDEHVVSSLWL